MTGRKLFESMGDDAKRFYSKVFNTVILNDYAVKRGWFDVRFCESDDPTLTARWQEAVPQIVMLVKVEQAKKKKKDEDK